MWSRQYQSLALLCILNALTLHTEEAIAPAFSLQWVNYEVMYKLKVVILKGIPTPTMQSDKLLCAGRQVSANKTDDGFIILTAELSNYIDKQCQITLKNDGGVQMESVFVNISVPRGIATTTAAAQQSEGSSDVPVSTVIACAIPAAVVIVGCVTYIVITTILRRRPRVQKITHNTFLESELAGEHNPIDESLQPEMLCKYQPRCSNVPSGDGFSSRDGYSVHSSDSDLLETDGTVDVSIHPGPSSASALISRPIQESSTASLKPEMINAEILEPSSAKAINNHYKGL